MSVSENWNVLRIKESNPAGDDEITPAMVDALRHRIAQAGGLLVVWAILKEDCYETWFGDGFYLHVRGLALNEEDANRLAELGRAEEDRITNANGTTGYKLHVRSFALTLKDNLPVFVAQRKPEEEFTIGEFVRLFSDVPPGGTASKLSVGWNARKGGLFITLPKR